MLKVNFIFDRIEKLIHSEGHKNFLSVFENTTQNADEDTEQANSYIPLNIFLQKLYNAIDEVANEIKHDDTILISVKNQKLLRTCFQLITSLGISTCLIPGLGVNLTKRCSSAIILPQLILNDEQKYNILAECTDFITRNYEVPVLKKIILTLHLSDYLAALIQLSYAPLKKPGHYNNFVMTEQLYQKLNNDRQHYTQVYNNLVTNCFQPALMKELLVLQSVTDPAPPNFVRRLISKEMSLRLLAPGGLLSLIRCFIESYDIDTGYEWRKIDMICRIIVAKHGTGSEYDYVCNICSQLKQILCLNNTHYLATAVACVLSLNEKYTHADPVRSVVQEVFQAFDYKYLITHYNLPGTIILSPQEVEQKINVLHACVCLTKLEWPIHLLTPNLYMLFLIGVKSTKNEEMNMKLQDIVIKTLEKLCKDELHNTLNMFFFGIGKESESDVSIEEYEAGVTLKSIRSVENQPNDNTLQYFLHIFKAITDSNLVKNIFEVSLDILINLSVKRQRNSNKDMLLIEDEPVLLDDVDKQYGIILQLLSEISDSTKIITALKTDPSIVFNFIEHFILKQSPQYYDECVTIALVLLNTIITNSNQPKALEERFNSLVPMLRKIADDDSSLNNILCKEILSLLKAETVKKVETAYGKAIAAIFDNLLPIRAHGMIELTKLIDVGDVETLSKKHYIFCLFQEQLKDPDSYIYLAAVNGLASLCTYCPEDVLHILCKEFLQVSTGHDQNIETKECQNKIAELRMKVGDVIVKVTKRLGEMAIVHKTVLLNTMLCGCRDDDPLLRTSALSNLAEIALVLNYRIGSIIYEVLLCIWSILESDKAVECRRAAVMVISNLIKGLGKETLIQLKENLLPIYRTLKELYRDNNEDPVLRLHAQIALEELNDVVKDFLFPEVKIEKQIFVLDKPQDTFK